MGQITIEKNLNGIEGLCLITPAVHGDSRGYFTETYSARDMTEAGIDIVFVQDNQSMSTKGVLRGLHFQKQYPQTKLVRVIKGAVFDVAVDLRSGSKSYGQWHGELLTEENKKQFLIPRGFAHGFLVLSDTAEFCYKCDDLSALLTLVMSESWHPEYAATSKKKASMREVSVDAERVKRFRARQALCAAYKVEIIGKSKKEEEEYLWEVLKQLSGCIFHTAGRGHKSGVKFRFGVKGGEMKVDRKEKTITKATVLYAYWKAKDMGIVKGPKALGVPGAQSYLLPVFLRLGVCQTG